MDQANSPQKSHVASGKERRTHVRYPVSVKLDLMIQGIGPRKAEARDFCLGGLLIVFDPADPLPTTNSLSGTLCLVTLHIENEDYRLRARIAHADAESAGVSFINPDTIALQAMQKHARIDAHPSNQQGNIATSTPTDNAKPASKDKTRLLNLCNAVIDNMVTPLVKLFMDKANDDFFNTAKNSTDLAVQNLHFQALEALNTNKNLMLSAFGKYIATKLQQNHTLQSDTSMDEMDEDASLALISEEDFNVWLANSKVIYKIESEFPTLLGGLERRLSVVYDEAVDRKNNPYSPCLFVQAFQHAIELLELRNEVMPACYEAFKKALWEKSGDLYTNLNKILIDNNILPDLKAVLASTRKQNPVAQTRQTYDTTENTEQQSPSAENQAQPAQPVTEPAVAQQNLYQIVGEIRELQAQLRHLTGHAENQHAQVKFSPTTAETVPPAITMPTYSTAEALDVITRIQTPVLQFRGDGQALAQFRQQLDEYLQPQDGSSAQKTLSTQHTQVIDVTENVFTALLNDLQVAQSVRPWLERLAVPVMKMALLDENIFTDKNHVVRNVINKLAELEVLASVEDAEEQAAVRQAFNWVINLVNNEFDGTTNVYTRAVQQLEILIKVQQKSFEKNLKEVVAEAVREEREQSTRQIIDVTAEPDTSEASDDNWLRMVSRLKENHWVLFDTYSDEPKRLKVAWIAPRKGKYIFVNVMGRKERIYTNDQLAELFASGEAVILDSTDDPAMDRAQYSMLQKLHKQLLHQSTHDQLTGLINRREFTNCMQAALDDAIQNNTKHAICFLDIDNFKVINNNYGYDAGDQLLLQLVDLVNPNIKEENILSRIGADHFALLLQGISMDDAVETIENIMDALQEYRFAWQETRMAITMSAGIAIINAGTENLVDLLHSAETSCNMAKEAGGNQIQIFHSGSKRMSRRKQETEWATKIDKALDENALYLRCQKIVPIQPHLDERPHYEVLLGISDDLGGNSALETFIKAAELHNRMLAVDRWVISKTFAWLANNEDVITDISAFTINLSGQSLNNENFIDFVYQEVSRTAVPIERICFEITETAGVTNLSDAADFIQTIKSTGCLFALDDFGSGMSSYSYLKNLPVDYLKIDGAFIKDITTNQNDFAVVKSICEIGHFMEKTVIAEFVQDETAVRILKEIGVDYGQGYGIAMPHNLDDLLH